MMTQDQKIGPIDLELMRKGVHYELYKVLGAHVCDGGTRFAVWAPDVKQVFVAGDFNDWQTKTHPMCAGDVWELFVPGVGEGTRYKYVIETVEGHLLWKADPFAFRAQLRPETASVVYEVQEKAWSFWEFKGADGPVNIFEVHLGSWKQGLSYVELAEELGPYCTEHGFTHLEILPVTEHPLDESWGYQVCGFFAPTSRYGSPEDFQTFVDRMHVHGIGVILDWVPGHFPADSHGLARFNGQYLYEYADPKIGFHPKWTTHVFDYAHPMVCNFLLASALYWLDKFHLDGLRVDAVESIIMRDYAREDWIPNIHGGRENLEAIEFLRHLNSIVKEKFPGRITCAEDSSEHPGMTHPLVDGGLGFDLKWSLGWTTDTRAFLSTHFDHRDLNILTNLFDYVLQERSILPLSHDDVMHERGSLYRQMYGDDCQKRAQMRLFFTWQMFFPSKKLIFMGQNIAQIEDWDVGGSLNWKDADQGMVTCLKELGRLYTLWADTDHDPSVKWEVGDFLTVKKYGYTALFNFGLKAYPLNKPIVFSSDNVAYGGMNREGLPPLTALILQE